MQQLCEAGEEEFLEIMMLVDMATKPLHVRRLQKALQEWVQNPGEIMCTHLYRLNKIIFCQHTVVFARAVKKFCVESTAITSCCVLRTATVVTVTLAAVR